MKNKERLLEIDLLIEEIDLLIEEKEKHWDNSKTWTEYKEYMGPEWQQLNEFSRERRSIMPYKLTPLPDYGDTMSLDDFIENVKCGGFIDYDGFGHYIKDGQETNIEIYPSDVKHNAIREEFDSIIWFNR